MKLPITIIFFMFLSNSYAQREILYDLDDYKQVVFKLSSLTVNPSGGFLAGDRINVEGEEVYHDIDFGGIMSHHKTINNQDQQYELDQQFSFNISDGYRIDGTRQNNKRSYTGNRYLKMGSTLALNVNKNAALFGGTQNDIGKVKIQGNFGLGFGRLEFINHAWSAVQIIQSLEDNGLLERMPTIEEITIFADKIGKIRTRRIIDFRLRDIAILETIIDHLKDNNFIDDLSTRAILIIEDTFEYDQIESRLSGKRLEFALDPFFSYEYNKNFNVTNRLIESGAIGTITYEKHKNIDVKWYKTETYESSLLIMNRYLRRSDVDTTLQKTTLATAAIQYSYGYKYIPNLRNNYSFFLNSGPSINISKTASSSYRFSTVQFFTNLNLAYRHYFSPATSVFVNGTFGYLDTEFQYGHYQPSINGTITFSIFHSVF